MEECSGTSRRDFWSSKAGPGARRRGFDGSHYEESNAMIDRWLTETSKVHYFASQNETGRKIVEDIFKKYSQRQDVWWRANPRLNGRNIPGTRLLVAQRRVRGVLIVMPKEWQNVFMQWACRITRRASRWRCMNMYWKLLLAGKSHLLFL